VVSVCCYRIARRETLDHQKMWAEVGTDKFYIRLCNLSYVYNIIGHFPFFSYRLKRVSFRLNSMCLWSVFKFLLNFMSSEILIWFVFLSWFCVWLDFKREIIYIYTCILYYTRHYYICVHIIRYIFVMKVLKHEHIK